jgi:type VI secretion system protein ImpG
VAVLGSNGRKLADALPFYAARHHHEQAQHVYYMLQRRPGEQAPQENRHGSYVGTDCYLSLSDPQGSVRESDVQQLEIRALCTNGDLPLQFGFGEDRTDFILDGDAPLYAVKLIVGPTAPRLPPAGGDAGWKFLKHLSLNYLALSNAKATGRAELLRELLSLYANRADAGTMRQIESIRSIRFDPIFERVPVPGPLSYGRGHRVALQMDDDACEGTASLLLGSVLERFFSSYAAINSFTQLSLQSSTRGEVKRWPVRFGIRPSI